MVFPIQPQDGATAVDLARVYAKECWSKNIFCDLFMSAPAFTLCWEKTDNVGAWTGSCKQGFFLSRKWF